MEPAQALRASALRAGASGELSKSIKTCLPFELAVEGVDVEGTPCTTVTSASELDTSSVADCLRLEFPKEREGCPFEGVLEVEAGGFGGGVRCMMQACVHQVRPDVPLEVGEGGVARG